MKKFADGMVEKCAVAPYAGTAGALTGIACDATGYARAFFTFNLATGLSGATFDAAIYKASTSGGTYAAITSASLTQVTTGAGNSILASIDVPVDSANPWLKVSGSVGTSTWPNAATVTLYRGIAKAPTATAQQVVTV